MKSSLLKSFILLIIVTFSVIIISQLIVYGTDKIIPEENKDVIKFVGKGRENVNRISLRTQPDEKTKVSLTISPRVLFDVIGKDNNFYKMKYNDEFFYIAEKDAINTSDSVQGKNAKLMPFVSDFPLRYEADSTSEIVANINSGIYFEILEVYSDGWLYVKYLNYYGYIQRVNVIPSTPLELKVDYTDPYKPYTYEKCQKEIKALGEKYSNIISVSVIGKSSRGKDLTLIKLGKGSKKVLYVGAIHGTEYVTTSYLMKMIDTYCYSYTNDIRYGEYETNILLDEYTVYIIPMANPDGVDIVNIENNKIWRQNGNGVNLNKNFPTNRWEDIDNGVTEPGQDFKGYSKGSELETKLLIDLCENNYFEFLMSFHSKGEVLFWRDENSGVIPGAQELADKIESLTGYAPQLPTKSPTDYGGGFENWFRWKYNRPGFCVETCPSTGVEYPVDDFEFDTILWNKAKFLGLELLT